MKIDNSILTLDIKLQDKYRELLANIADGSLNISCVQLGDSDIDYENTQDMSNSRILNAPFNVEKIKYPLIYDGTGRGLEGRISCFARKVNSDGTLSSIYNWPNDFIWTVGDKVPPVYNGYDWNALQFDNTQMGYILFFQTILNNFYDSASGLTQRMIEKIDVEVTFNGSKSVPTGWEITRDEDTKVLTINNTNYTVYNNSMLIAKTAGPSLTSNTNGLITAKGSLSNIVKNITFNI